MTINNVNEYKEFEVGAVVRRSRQYAHGDNMQLITHEYIDLYPPQVMEDDGIRFRYGKFAKCSIDMYAETIDEFEINTGLTYADLPVMEWNSPIIRRQLFVANYSYSR